MSDETEEENKLQQGVKEPRPLEAAFRDFLDSGQPTIPNIVVMPPPNAPPTASSSKGEFFSAGYALGLAALLTGAIFAAIALGVSYSDGVSEGKIGSAIEEAITPLQQEIEVLQDRIDALEAAQQPAQP